MKKEKMLRVIVAIALLLQLLPLHFVSAAVPENLTNQDDYLVVHGTNYVPDDWGGPSSITITAPGGDVRSPVGGVYSDIPVGSSIVIDYAFHLEDGDGVSDIYTYLGSNHFIIDLPEGVTFDAPVGDQANVYAIDKTDPSNPVTWVMATWSFLDGQTIKVQFTPDVATHSSMWAAIHIEGEFQALGPGDGTGTSITFGTQTVVINREPPVVPTIDIEKEGEYDATENEITWTVTVSPPTAAPSLEGYSLVDEYDANQTYKAGSFYVGTTHIADTALDLTTSNQVTYTFPAGTSGETVVTYKTVPVDFSGEDGTTDNEAAVFGNIATLKAGNTVISGPASDEVTLDWVEKEGAVLSAQDDLLTVLWTVEVHVPGEAGGTVSGATIVDTLPAGFKLVEGSGTYPIKIDFGTGSATTVSSGAGWGTYSYSGNTLTYRFPTADAIDGELTGTATLTFYTQVENRDTFLNRNDTISFKNDVQFKWDQVSNLIYAPGDSASVSIGSGGLLSKWAGGGTEPYVYTATDPGTIHWTITVNRNKVSITNAQISDTVLPGHRLLIDGTHPFTVKREGTAFFTATSPVADTYFTSTDAFATHFAYAFPNEPGGTAGVISKTYTIDFYTRIVDTVPDEPGDGSGLDTLYINSPSDSPVEFGNRVTLTRTGSTVGPVTGIKKYHSQVIAKTAVTQYDYTTRTVQWQIVVNRNKLPLTGATVSDTLPPGMELLIDDDLYPFTVTPLGGTATVTAPTTGATGDPAFTYSFGDIQNQYTIRFYTLMKEDTLLTQWPGNDDFTNKVTLCAEELTNPIKATATVQVRNPVITKTHGYQTGADHIDWSVVINPGKILLENAIVTDILHPNLQLDPDSIKLYTVGVDASGTVAPASAGTLVTTGYSVEEYPSAANDNEFTVRLPGNTRDTYRLEFTTNVLDDLSFSNTVSLTGYSGGNQAGATASQVVITNLWSSGGSGSRTLTVHKEDTNGDPVENAEFQLLNLNLDPVLRSGVPIKASTNTNGDAIFTNLPSWLFYVKEVSVPDGYLLDPTPFGGERLTQDLTFPFVNELALGILQFDKTTDAGFPLSNGEFTLTGTDYANNPVVLVRPSVNGVVTFENVPLGTYTIEETKAPPGYALSDVVLTATVTYNNDRTDVETEVTPDTMENTPLPGALFGSIEILKKDPGGQALSGATFSLYSEYGVIVATAVSDLNGVAVFNFVPVGNYTLQETKAPAGYQLNTEIISVTVENMATYTFTVINETETTSPAEVGSIQIIKTGENGILLAGAVFTLYDASGTPVQTAVTNASGLAVFENVPAGDYTVSETQAPAGYIASTGGTAVTVTGGVTSTLSVTNEKIPVSGPAGSIQIRKVDSQGAALAGATFTLYDAGGAVVATAVSGADGLVLFTGLAPGQYTLRETAAPDGYALFSEPLTVTIAGDQTLVYSLRNALLDEDGDIGGWIDEPSDPDETLPQTGGIPPTFLLLLVGVTLFGAGFIPTLCKRRRKN